MLSRRLLSGIRTERLWFIFTSSIKSVNKASEQIATGSKEQPAPALRDNHTTHLNTPLSVSQTGLIKPLQNLQRGGLQSAAHTWLTLFSWQYVNSRHRRSSSRGPRHANELLTLMGTPLLWQPRTAACIVLRSQTPACRSPGHKQSQFFFCSN